MSPGVTLTCVWGCPGSGWRSVWACSVRTRWSWCCRHSCHDQGSSDCWRRRGKTCRRSETAPSLSLQLSAERRGHSENQGTKGNPLIIVHLVGGAFTAGVPSTLLLVEKEELLLGMVDADWLNLEKTTTTRSVFKTHRSQRRWKTTSKNQSDAKAECKQTQLPDLQEVTGASWPPCLPGSLCDRTGLVFTPSA